MINYCYDLRGDPEAEPKTYWLNTSGNDMVRRLIEKTSDGMTQMEVKDVKDERKLNGACETAVRQIEEKDYTAILRRYRVKEIWIYGIAFWEKECRVTAKRKA